MTQFTLLDILVAAGVGQGFFLAISLRVLQKRNKAANRVLSNLLLIATIVLLGRLTLARFHASWLWSIAIVLDSFIFVVGPLIYHYCRQLLFDSSKNSKVATQQFLPAFVHLLYAFVVILLPATALQMYFKDGWFKYISFFVELFGIVLLAYYIVRSFWLLHRYNEQKDEELATLPAVYSFLVSLLVALGILTLFWALSFLNAYFIQWQIGFLNYNTLWIVIPLFIYLVGFFSLSQPEIFRLQERKNTHVKQRLNDQMIHALSKRLTYFMEEEQLFLQNDLTLKTLANQLGSSSNDISWLLNNVIHSSFYQYVNKYRIAHFLSQLRENNHEKMTLLAIALDSGFNSKTTFNKAFKSELGLTPSAYIRQKTVA